MSEEEINNDPNYPNNSYRTTDDYHKQQQDVVTGGQLEQISKFLLECTEAALNVSYISIFRSIMVISNNSSLLR